MSGPDDGAEYYRANYPDYERQNSPRKLEFYLSLVRTWAPPPARLHELGVGLGAFLERATAEYACTGSDVNQFGVEATRRRAPRAGLRVGSYDETPADPAPDVVVAWDVLEHIPDLDDALGVLHARLEPSGVLVAVVPVYDGPLGWLVERLDRDPIHVSKWPRRQWVAALERHGFDVLATGGVLRRLLFGRWYVHLTRPARLWRWAGSAFWFAARATRAPAAARPEAS
jgi:SAM-dependent methyltransferase